MWFIFSIIFGFLQNYGSITWAVGYKSESNFEEVNRIDRVPQADIQYSERPSEITPLLPPDLIKRRLQNGERAPRQLKSVSADSLALIRREHQRRF